MPIRILKQRYYSSDKKRSRVPRYIQCFLLISVLLSASAIAGNAAGRITKLQVLTNSNSAVFTVSGEIDNPASCNKWQTFAVNLKTTSGQAIFEIVKEAFLNNLDIDVEGLGTCIAHWRSEDVKTVITSKQSS